MAGLLIYDGDCGFCTATAAWMMDRLDPDVDVEAWQQLDLDRYGLTASDGQKSSWWIDDDGVAIAGALGIAEALKSTQPRWTRLAGTFVGSAPVQPVAKLVYKGVVRYRHKLPGSTDVCRMRYDTNPE
jgi:predicted DCC family thiol-disulfide oxidoreductase YuxK